MLPPEAWTQVLNMRVLDGGLVKLPGWEQVFGTPGVAPHFIMAVKTASQNFWLYVSLTKTYDYDGTTHNNITRQVTAADVNWTANDTPDWNGTLLGGVPILNNGIDIPQFWTVGATTKMVNLTNWPSTLRAKILRAFGPYLVAGNITDTGVVYPHAVQWSHPADPGSVPSSWDITDATKDTGRKDLPDVQAGLLQDMLQLGSFMYLYKGSSVWKMRFIGGRFIFDFGDSAWLTTLGLLAPRCVATTGDGTRHVLATQEDIVWHNGSQVDSILNARQKRRLFNELDTTHFNTSFMFANPYYNEMWFCYPSSGQSYPDKVLIMNYGTGKWVVTEADGITFRHAATGDIEAPSSETWAQGTDTWDQDTGPWSEIQRRRVILAGAAATKFYNMDKGVSRDGTTFSTNLQRIGLALVGKKRNGDLIVDHQVVKMLDGIWPKIQGGPVNIRFGAQQVVNGAVEWGASVAFDPATQKFCHPEPATGCAVGIEYSTSVAVSWRIDGYKIGLTPLGQF